MRRQRIFRHAQFGVRHGVVQVEEERTRVGLLDEGRRLAREQVVDVVALEIGGDRLAVAIQVIGELPVRVAMIEEAEGEIEALLAGFAAGARLAEAPLADHRGAVAGVAQRHRHGDVLVAQRDFTVAADPDVPGVQAGHQRRARRRADRAPRVVLGEPDPFGRQPIEGRRLKLRLSVRAQIAVAEVVRLDEDDVRP